MALFLPSLSLPSISFVSLLQACIYIYTHTYIPKCPSFSRLVSFHSCRFTKCSHFKQYPGYSCTLVRRRRTRIREREHRPTVPPPFQATPLAPSPSVHPPMPTFSYQPPIPSRRFFISESPAVAVSSIPAGVEEQFSFRHAAEYWLERASANPFLPRFLRFPSSLARIGIYSPIRLGSLFERGICKFCCWINLKNDEDS